MPQTIDDQASRKRIATDLDTSLLVEAAAGTGKTTELVARLVAVLENGRTTVERVVAVTFTRKAAGELKLRLRQALDARRGALAGDPAAADARACLERAIARLEEAHIGTIHGFCAEVLRQRPVAAGIDPAFVELDEEESARLYDRVFRAWIERTLDDLPEGLRRALSRLAHERTYDGSSPLDRLRDAGRALVDWRDFPAPWRREPLERESEVDRLVAEVDALAACYRASRNRRDYLRRAIEPAEALRVWIAATETAGGDGEPAAGDDGAAAGDDGAAAGTARDYDAIEARLLELLRDLRRNQGWRGRGRWFAEGLARDDVRARRDELIVQLDAFKRAADADLAALLRAELGAVVVRYEEAKRRAGALDFLDLLLITRDLVRDQPAVRHHLQRQLSHLFVDELQDTDPLQAEILLLLAADDPEETDWRRVRPQPGKLFLVGDPKQSIYRFRRADVVLYQAIKEQLAAAGVAILHLSRSFRAVAPLQDAVNAAFAPHMTGDRDSGQPEYVPLLPYRQAPDAQPTLVAVPAPTPYSYSRITQWQIDNCLPTTVAAWVAWLLHDSGWTVADPESGQRVPVRPRHVALLFRRFLSWQRDVSRPYVRELEARGVPHLLIGGRSFHQREEVETVRAALTAIEWPDDELAVFATLKGSLFAVPDKVLLRFRLELKGRLHPFWTPPADLSEDFAPVLDALALLRRLHRGRNQVPIAETLHRLLEATRADAGFALRPAGNQVLANIQRIRDLARGFEVRGGLSFRGFVERLAEEAESIGASYAPVLEEGADGVRLMTVHAAKGLEFPVVVLADLTARLTPFEPGQHIDLGRRLHAARLLGCAPWELLDQADLERRRDQAEGVRLAYVAATRARDLLAVPAIGDGPYRGGWTSPLDRALYPPKDAYRETRPAPGCPPFGPASVLQRPQDFDRRPEGSVAPGGHRAEAGNEVVWWDPALLASAARANVGLIQEDLLTADDGGEDQAGLNRYRRWQVAREDAVAAGSEPSRTVVAVGDAGEPPDLFLLDIRTETLPRSAGRPRGPRFGTLVHTVLRDVAFDADEAAVRALAALHGRVLEATGAEVAAAAHAVHATLCHPLLRRAARAERRYREAPFLLRQDGGRVVEGTLDLAFRDSAEGWIVVDFKTDADAEGLEDRYRRQLGWYLSALQAIAGEPARGVLLAV